MEDLIFLKLFSEQRHDRILLPVKDGLGVF